MSIPEETPSPKRPPHASPASTNSTSSSVESGAARRDELDTLAASLNASPERAMLVEEAALALVEAAKVYKKQDAEAYSEGNYYDDYVKAEFPKWLSVGQLGEACDIAERTVGKLKVEAFGKTSEFFVRQVASGYTHGEAVGEVLGQISGAAHAYSRLPQRFVRVGTDALYGSELISAPDVTVRSVGHADGSSTGDSEHGPLFFAEVERGNRSLPELIRHMGMLLANFPNLNGVLGIKGEEAKNGNQLNALILIEWRTGASGNRQPHVVQLVDFGPHAYSDTLRRNANDTLQLALPPVGVKAQSGVHGAGTAATLPEWTRLPGGQDAQGDSAIISIPATLLLAGSHSTGANGAIIDIPPAALPAAINLEEIVNIFYP